MKRYEKLLAIVVLINILGSIFGYYYYHWLLISQPLKFWIFISDSPNATLLFTFSLLFLLMKKKHDLLSFIASIASIKYGFWTIFVILFYSSYFLSPENRLFYYVMIVLHFGMIVQPVLILHAMNLKFRYLFVSLFWFLLNDYFDYFLGFTSLKIYSFTNMEVVARVSIASSILLTFLIYHLSKRMRSDRGIIERFL